MAFITSPRPWRPPLPLTFRSKMTAMRSGTPTKPMTTQKVLHPMPSRNHRAATTNCPADPPAIPNICVAPISVAARDAGKLFVAM